MKALVVWIASSCLLVGCGGDRITGPEVVSDAWELFETGNTIDARARFEKAIDLDSTLADAHNGRGWCLLRQNSLAAARESFDRAIANGLASADALAGRAAVNRDIPDLPAAVQDALAALDMDPDWVFIHDTTIDYQDVRIILAQSYFGLKNYGDAQLQVDILDPGNGLDPERLATWQIAGVVYGTYQEALLMEIELLEDSLGTP